MTSSGSVVGEATAGLRRSGTTLGIQAVFVLDIRVAGMSREERRREGLAADAELAVSREMGVLARRGLVSTHFDIRKEALNTGEIYSAA